ncbi:MAG: hypothetical protein CMH57_04135 [Myxococcales bacterium]|nr:hypothetical protein [Myxococcales bacterium]
MTLILTTSRSNRRALEPTARALAEALQLPFVTRSVGLARLMDAHGAWGAYVVSQAHHTIEAASGEQLVVGPGMFYLKRLDGRDHPLIRAIAPAEGRPVREVWDGTLGLAGDALHIAHALQVAVFGVEASPVLAALVGEGLARMSEEGRAWSEAAGRVRVMEGRAQERLAGVEADVVYLDPMFTEPAAAASGFGIVRRLAVGAPLGEALLEAACGAARRRVVVKWPGGVEAPEVAPSGLGGWNRRVRGRAVDYLVAEYELEDPVYEAPDHGCGAGS